MLSVVAISVFALIAVFGFSILTGNTDQSNVGTSYASTQEPADINSDNTVNVFDLSILLSKWNTADTTSDLNKDGTVNVFDLSILLSKWGVVTVATCTVSDKLVNSCRPWIAAAASGYTMAGSDTQSVQIPFFEKRLNDPTVLTDPGKSVNVVRQLDFIHVYKSNAQILNAVEKNYAARAGTYLQVNYKPVTGIANPWKESDGRNATVNANIDGMANSIKSLAPKKVMLSIFHEPENDVTTGSAGTCATASGASTGTTTEYRAMWQNVRARFDALGVSNVIWNMNYMGFDSYNCLVPLLWPGNSYVDWVTYDPYVGGNATASTGYRGTAGMTSKFYNFLESTSDTTHDYNSKPWGFSEFGYWNQNGTSTEDQAPIYWQTVKQAYLAGEYPRIKLFSVFDTSAAEGYVFSSLVGLQFNNTVTPNMAEQAAYNDFAQTVLNTGQ